MAALDIDRHINSDKLKSRIYRIGVELEGGWEKRPSGVLIERDGSVNFPSSVTASGDIQVGEIASAPKVPISMWPWMRKYYPSHINDTCGLHVHMSFESAVYYQMLMVPEYQDTVIEYLKRWAKEEGIPESHPIWPRLRGENRFCKLEFWPDQQVKQTHKIYDQNRPGHRYTAINYCYAKDNCQTVECRVLPMLDTSEQAIRAVKRILAITDACLVVLARQERKVNESIQVPMPNKAQKEHSIELIVR